MSEAEETEFTVPELIALRGWAQAKVRGFTYPEYRNARAKAKRKLR